jgi:5-methylcytosine-specific restriction endonuclease McrA
MPALRNARQEARIQCSMFYCTGKACKRGHISKRRTITGQCLECEAITRAIWAKANRLKVNQSSSEWRANNREKVLAAQRKFDRKRVGQIRCSPEAKKKWAQAHKDRVNASARKWYWDNREQARERQIGYRQDNPEVFRANARNRKARVRGAKGKHTKEDVLALYEAQYGKCIYCTAKLGQKYHVDHVIPIVLGGSNDKSNLQLLCPPCNLSKRSAHPIDFAQRLGLLL